MLARCNAVVVCPSVRLSICLSELLWCKNFCTSASWSVSRSYMARILPPFIEFMSYFITCSVVPSACRRYFSYSGAILRVFAPPVAASCTDWVEIWRGGVDRSNKLRLMTPYHSHPPGGKKVDVFCLFVRHASEWRSLWTPLRHEDIRIRKRSWYRWIGNVRRCALAFNLVSTTLGGAMAEWQSWKTVKFVIFRPSRATQWTDRDAIRHISVDYG